MTVETEKCGTSYILSLTGRLDTVTAPLLEAELKNCLTDTDAAEIVFDFEKLDYISSAGLRILLSAQKIMNKRGRMLLRHVGDDIREVFDITGFTEILHIE